jgi:hypothetical protein
MNQNIAFRENWDWIKKENRTLSIKISLIPHEYEVGDQVLLETSGILWILSTPCTGTYPEPNSYKNVRIIIQKGDVSEEVDIRSINQFN